MGPHMHCSALLLANWRPNHSREPQRPPRSRNLVNLDISKAATRMVTAHVQPDRDPAEVRQSAAARQHMQCGERDLCHAGSRFEGIADVRHPHGRTEYGRLCRRCAGAQAAPRGGAGMQPTKATIAELCAARAGRKWNFEQFKGHEPREDVPMQLASRSHAKPCPWRGERAAQSSRKTNPHTDSRPRG